MLFTSIDPAITFFPGWSYLDFKIPGAYICVEQNFCTLDNSVASFGGKFLSN